MLIVKNVVVLTRHDEVVVICATPAQQHWVGKEPNAKPAVYSTRRRMKSDQGKQP